MERENRQSTVFSLRRRGSKLPEIKRSRVNFFRTVVGDESSKLDFELTPKEFFMISAMIQMNFNYFMLFIDLASLYGGIFVCLFYLALQIGIGMPLYMLYTFMSSYSKKTYMKFWDCVPIFQGLGYTLAIMGFSSEMYNVLVSTMCLLLTFDMLQNSNLEKFTRCFGELRNITCIDIYSNIHNVYKCPTIYYRRLRNETVYIAPQHYFRHIMMGYNAFDHRCCTFNSTIIVASLPVWFLLFCVSVFGIKRIRKIAINVQFIAGAVLFIVAVYSVALSEGPIRRIDLSPETRLDNFEFWVDMILHSAETNIASSIIYLGALKPDSVSPTYAALIITVMKTALFILTICYTSRIRHTIIEYYKLDDQRCLISYSHDIIFAFVPDVLSRLQFGIIFIMLWYLAIFCFSMLSTIYSLLGLVDSLAEQFRRVSRYRLFAYLILCVVGTILHISLCSNISLSLVVTYRRYGIPMLNTTVLFLLTLALMFIYSVKRIVDDYSFTLGSAPHKYWIIFWSTTPLFTLFAFIFMIYQIQTDAALTITTSQLMIFSYVQSSLVLLPIGIVFLAKCCRHVKYRTLGSLSKPSDKWGPHNALKKQSRKFFYPQRDVKYRNNVLECRHNCMTHSEKFYGENKRQQHKLSELIEAMKKDHRL